MRPGFTTLELFLTIAVLGITAATVFVPLAGLQGRSALSDGAAGLTAAFRRAETQALAGYRADAWGIHLSDSDGCALPSGKYHVFRGGVFTSATDTIDSLNLPTGVAITGLSIGGGCDVKFARYDGSTTSTGTVTLTGPNGTRTITINGYGGILLQ